MGAANQVRWRQRDALAVLLLSFVKSLAGAVVVLQMRVISGRVG